MADSESLSTFLNNNELAFMDQKERRQAAKDAQQFITSVSGVQVEMAEGIAERGKTDSDDAFSQTLRTAVTLKKLHEAIRKNIDEVLVDLKRFTNSSSQFPEGIVVYDMGIAYKASKQFVNGDEMNVDDGLDGDFMFGRNVGDKLRQIGREKLFSYADEYAQKIAEFIELGLLDDPSQGEGVTQKLSMGGLCVARGIREERDNEGFPRSEKITVTESKKYPGVFLIKKAIQRKERSIDGGRPDRITETNIRVVVGDKQHLPYRFEDSSKYTWHSS